jgi:hypothetical protein
MAQCYMIIGALVPHRCSNKARAVCIQCERPFCDEHVNFTENGLICLACEKGYNRPVSSSDTIESTEDFNDADFDAFYEDDDPFIDLS